jgi:uncharacterized membrane protein YheB (UPF0754 family)
MKIKLQGLNTRNKYTTAIQARLDRVLTQEHLTQLDDLLSNFFKTLVKIFDGQSLPHIETAKERTFEKIDSYMRAEKLEEELDHIKENDGEVLDSFSQKVSTIHIEDTDDNQRELESLKNENPKAHSFIMSCGKRFGHHPKALLALLFHMDTASHHAVFDTLWNELYQGCIERSVVNLKDIYKEKSDKDLLILATKQIEDIVGKRKRGVIVKAGQGLKSTVSGNKRNDDEIPPLMEYYENDGKIEEDYV